MKITGAKVFVGGPGKNYVTLKIETDQGVYGLGDATLNNRETLPAAYLRDYLVPNLIGRDPRKSEDIWQFFYRGAYFRRGPVAMAGEIRVAVAQGQAQAAMRCFMDFWSGEGSFDAMDAGRRAFFAAQAQQVVDDFTAIESETTATDPLSLIQAPTQIVVGEHDAETTPAQGQQIFELLPSCIDRRFTVIGQGTHSLLLENNRHALHDVVAGFLA